MASEHAIVPPLPDEWHWILSGNSDAFNLIARAPQKLTLDLTFATRTNGPSFSLSWNYNKPAIDSTNGARQTSAMCDIGTAAAISVILLPRQLEKMEIFPLGLCHCCYCTQQQRRRRRAEEIRKCGPDDPVVRVIIRRRPTSSTSRRPWRRFPISKKKKKKKKLICLSLIQLKLEFKCLTVWWILIYQANRWRWCNFWK